MKDQALKYYMHDGPTAIRLELAGNLDQEGALRLDEDWQTASSVIGDRCLIVDITFLTSVDESGKTLLARWHREGARLVAESQRSRELAQWIIGEQPLPVSNARVAERWLQKWLPFRSLLILAAVLIFAIEIKAATLKPETVAAWNDYVSAANANLQARVRPGASFLWTFENADRAANVRNGEIVVAPAPGQNPKKVAGGLIHHWIGAMFVPNVALDDVLAVTRDYDHYKDFYSPSVIESKTIGRSGSDDRFSMMLMNKAFFLKTALDADYHAANVRLDDHRVYSISMTTRLQELEDVGLTSEHRIPEGEGGGYIWKLYSIARFEQRDGGVYVELEAMALSRDVPAMVRFMVDPIVRRVSRNSLLTSLQQTGQACHGAVAAGTKPADILTSAGQSRPLPATLSTKSSAFTALH